MSAPDGPAREDGTRRSARTPDWDPWATDAPADPFAVQAELREHCPFPFSDRQGGFTAITRYADIVRASMDPEHFRNGLRPKLGQPMPPLETDPPEHTFFRKLLQPHFGAPRMRTMEHLLRGFVIDVLEPLIARGHADFAEEFSFVVPIRAVFCLLNLPDADWPRVKEWSRWAYTVYAHMPEYKARFEAANRALYVYGHEILADRRRQPRDPADDIVTLLCQASMNGAPIPDATIVSVMRLLLTAGHESTTSALGNCILYLAQHPEAQAAMRANPAAIPTAIEEFRWDTPVMAMPRYVAADVELGGHRFAAGETVYLLYSSGNRDFTKFDTPDDCILDRKPNHHLAFGYGIHLCIGAPLARVELKVALEELLARTARFALAGEARRTIFHRRGVSALPLLVTRCP